MSNHAAVFLILVKGRVAPPCKVASIVVQKGSNTMPNVYIEARPKGVPHGSHIEDYVVEDHADHVLATFKTQHEAIKWAKDNSHHPLVARVRNLNDKKKADHWRAA